MDNEWVDFRAVKAAISLVVVLHAYGVDWLRARRPGQWEGRCPIHQGRRSDAFHVSVSKNAFHCFACQAGGNVRILSLPWNGVRLGRRPGGWRTGSQLPEACRRRSVRQEAERPTG